MHSLQGVGAYVHVIAIFKLRQVAQSSGTVTHRVTRVHWRTGSSLIQILLQLE